MGNKLTTLTQFIEQQNIELSEVVYVGNDINDLECIEAVGVSVAVDDAYPEVKAVADIVTRAPGGRGAVREICDLILESKRLK